MTIKYYRFIKPGGLLPDEPHLALVDTDLGQVWKWHVEVYKGTEATDPEGSTLERMQKAYNGRGYSEPAPDPIPDHWEEFTPSGSQSEIDEKWLNGLVRWSRQPNGH